MPRRAEGREFHRPADETHAWTTKFHRPSRSFIGRPTNLATAYRHQQLLDPGDLVVEFRLLALRELAEELDDLTRPSVTRHSPSSMPSTKSGHPGPAVGAHPVPALGRLGDPVAAGVGEPEVVVGAEQPGRGRGPRLLDHPVGDVVDDLAGLVLVAHQVSIAFTTGPSL